MAFPRLDRFATLYLSYPLRRLVRKAHRAVPILMYHSISEPSDRAIHPYYETRTGPAQFKAQMRYLQNSDYAALALTDLPKWFQSDEASRRKAVVITFDDGLRDFYTSAFAVLSQFRLKATMFLPTGCIGQEPNKTRVSDHLTWHQVRELRKHNILFGSHTVTHPVLSRLGIEKLEYELAHSKSTLEDQLGEAVACFSHPFAFPEEDRQYRERVRTLLRQCGYSHGVTTIVGTASASDDPLILKRLPVNAWDDPRFFRAKLEGAYDWFHTPQFIFKKLRAMSDLGGGNSDRG